jgi:hypothetical protein
MKFEIETVLMFVVVAYMFIAVYLRLGYLLKKPGLSRQASNQAVAHNRVY